MGWSGLVLRPAGDVLWGGPRDRPVPGLRQGSRENPGEIPALRVSGGEVFVCTLGVWPARGAVGSALDPTSKAAHTSLKPSTLPPAREEEEEKSHPPSVVIQARDRGFPGWHVCRGCGGPCVGSSVSVTPELNVPWGGAAGPGLGSLLLNEEVLPCFYVKKESI